MRWEVAAIILILLIWWFWPEEKLPAPKPTTAPVVRTVTPTKRKRYSQSRPGRGYPTHLLEKKFRADRMKLTHCFLKSETDIQSVELRLRALWDGMANLTKLEILPQISEQARVCIHDCLSSWQLPPHPNRAPFQFEQRIRF